MLEIELAKELISRKSITPSDGGCLKFTADYLEKLGFQNEFMPFEDVDNIWSVYDNGGPLLFFLGHVDVVPTGPEKLWTHDPFAAVEDEKFIHGRGACDMKGGVAAFLAALKNTDLEKLKYSLAVLLTSDEEGPAKNGTKMVIKELVNRGQSFDYCIVGEPSSIENTADNIRVGRRGSVNIDLKILGKQGHSAYPDKVDNPIHKAAKLVDFLNSIEWDSGDEYFPATSLQVADIHGGLGTHNVVPGELNLKINIRHNPKTSYEKIQKTIVNYLEENKIKYEINFDSNAKPFYSNPNQLADSVSEAVKNVMGKKPKISCSGGTSDGRFVAETDAEIVEIGPKFETIHKIDEKIEKKELNKLTKIYEQTLLNLNGKVMS